MNTEHETSPILVLGVGNRLLRDDGVGLVLLDRLHAAWGLRSGVEFVDGGTQGLALLGILDNRRAILVLDAVARGHEPGTVHCLHPLTDHAPHATTAHESSVTELLGVARLLGSTCPEICVIGVEPGLVRTGVGLTPAVEASLGLALQIAFDRLAEFTEHLAEAAHA